MRRKLNTLTLALLLVGTSVGAQPAQAQQPGGAPKPKPQPTAAKPGPAGPAGAVKPPDSFGYLEDQQEDRLEGFIAEKEKLISEKRRSMIRSLQDILSKNPYYAGKAGVLFRLAELEWEEAQYRYFLDRKRFEKEYEAFLEGSVRVQPPEPKPDFTTALNYYKQILKEFPSYERIDQVMYYLGYGLIRAGKEKEGASYYSRLIKGYPSSKYLPDAYLAVAEYYFKNDLLFAARTNYQECLKYKDSPVYNYALYKLGWVYYNLKEWRLAIDTFKAVIEGLGSDTTEQKKIEFRRQAMNDLVVVMAEVPDGWIEVRDYFTRLGGDKLAWEKLKKLVEKFVSDDKNEEVITVIRYFLSKKPNDPGAVVWYQSMADATRRMNDKPGLERMLREIVEFFAEKGTWAVVNRANEAIFRKSQVFAEDSLDFVATGYHQRAQKTNDRAAYLQASKDYELFLERFAKSDKAYKIRFFLAEIYFFELQEWEKAANAYLAVVKVNPKGEYVEDAAYGSVLAFQQLMDPERARSQRVRKGKPGKMKIKEARLITDAERELKPTPLNKWESRFIEACDAFRVWLPKSDHTPEVLFYAAEVLREHDMLAEAIPRLETIVEHHAKHKYAGHAANSIFGAASLLKKWDLVEKWARHLIGKRNFTVKKKADLQKVIAIALSQQADDLQRENRFDEAAQKMVDLQNEFPKHELAPKALFNAAAIYERGKKTDRALELYNKLIRAYPEHEVTPQAVFVVGAIHEARTEFEKAADTFESLKRFPTHSLTPDAIYNAGAIRKALGKHADALRAFELYMELYKKRPDLAQVYLLIGDIYGSMGDWPKAKDHYRDFSKRFPKAATLIVKANLLAGKAVLAERPTAHAEAGPFLAAAVRQFKRLSAKEKEGKARHWAAEARFLEGEAQSGRMKDVQLALPEGVFRRRIKEKAELQVKAQAIYQDVFAFKSNRWSAAGATRVGDLYVDFSEALYRVPIPAELNPDEQEIYRALIDEVAFPLQEKAIASFQTAVALAQEKDVYSTWSAAGARSLAKLSPETFPLTREESVRGDHQSVRPAPGAFVDKAVAPAPALPMPPAMPGLAPGAVPGTPATIQGAPAPGAGR